MMQSDWYVNFLVSSSMLQKSSELRAPGARRAHEACVRDHAANNFFRTSLSVTVCSASRCSPCGLTTEEDGPPILFGAA